MASNRISRDGSPMNMQEVSIPRTPTVQMDNDENRRWPTYRDEEYYNMGHKQRGKLIIFNHETFKDNLGLKVRTGTQNDKFTMKRVFAKMGFQVDTYDDLSSAEIQSILQNESQEDDYYQDSDCLVVAVMSHGEDEGMVYANYDCYHVEVLWKEFMANRCRPMAGKPKVFIIQACRGNEASMAVRQPESCKTQIDGIMRQDNSMRYSIPSEADVLIAYSTFPGRVAHRDTQDGSWFIQELCNELEDTGKSDDFLSILTKVNRRVALNYENDFFKQMPMLQSTLTRKICFGGNSLTAVDSHQPSSNRLDKILEMLHDMSAEPPRRTLNKPQRSSEWDAIKPLNESFEITQTDDQIVKIASALKLLLSDKNQMLQESVREDGDTILNLVSVWGSLLHDQRCFVYRRLVNFLKANGRDWEYLKMVNLPQLGANKQRRYSSPTMSAALTDGRRSIDRRLTRRIPK